jgi:hypothetical protein
MTIPVTFKAYARSISKRSWVKRELRWYLVAILEDDRFPKAKEGEWEIVERYLQDDDVWEEYDLEAFKELWGLFEYERRWYREQVLTGKYAAMKANIKAELARKKAQGSYRPR